MRFERGEGASHADIWRESVPDRGRPRVWNTLGILRSTGRPVILAWNLLEQRVTDGVRAVGGGHITGLMGFVVRTPQGYLF